MSRRLSQPSLARPFVPASPLPLRPSDLPPPRDRPPPPHYGLCGPYRSASAVADPLPFLSPASLRPPSHSCTACRPRSRKAGQRSTTACARCTRPRCSASSSSSARSGSAASSPGTEEGGGGQAGRDQGAPALFARLCVRSRWPSVALAPRPPDYPFFRQPAAGGPPCCTAAPILSLIPASRKEKWRRLGGRGGGGATLLAGGGGRPLRPESFRPSKGWLALIRAQDQLCSPSSLSSPLPPTRTHPCARRPLLLLLRRGGR